MQVVENTPDVHNVTVCTLCSCYPWPVLGLPPVWYKSAPIVRVSLSTRAAFWPNSGVNIPESKEVRVWDSSAELRYLVLPERPAGTDGWSEAQLIELVTPRFHDRHRPGRRAIIRGENHERDT